MPGAGVTILTRTLGRPCLAEAAASVAAQTLRPREWLVVDASGAGLRPPAAGDVPVRVVGAGERLPRSRAANLGLDRAEGARAMFLDDDDLLAPDAVRILTAALDALPGPALAYGNVRAESGGLPSPDRFALDYADLLLLRRNVFPNNAAMFDLAPLREHAIRVDETLDWFEDWDFWIRLSAHVPFHHVPHEVATYRMGLSESGVWRWAGPGADPRMREQKAIVESRHAARRLALEARHREAKAAAAAIAREGRAADALAAWLAAAANDPLDPEPPIAASRLLASGGDASQARAVLESAVARMPRQPLLHAELARVYEAAGDASLAARARDDARRYARAASAR